MSGLVDSEVQSCRKWCWLDWACPAVFFFGLALLWRHLNKGPTQWDDSWYLTDSLHLFDALKKWGLGGWGRCYLFEVQSRFKAPLPCALPTPIYLLFGRNPHPAILINYFFLAVLFWSLYSIARRFWGRRVAVLAVWITGSLTETFLLTNWYLVELGLAALVLATIWSLIQSQDLTRTRWVLLLGVLLGLGMLQKILYPAYVLPILVFYLFRGVKKRREPGSPRAWTTYAALLVPAMIVAGPWYLANFRIAVNHAYFSAYSKEEGALYSTGVPLSFGAMTKYFFMIINEGIGAPYFCLAIVAVVVWVVLRCLGRKGRESSECDGRGRIVLLLWGLPFSIFLLGINKQVRFIEPMLPIFSIFLAVILAQIIGMAGRGGRVFAWGVVAVAIGFLLQLFFEPLGARTLAFGTAAGRANDDKQGVHFFDEGMAFTRMYEPNRWPLAATLREVIAISPAKWDGKHYFRLMTASDSLHFNVNNLELAAVQGRIPIDVYTTAYYDDPAKMWADIQGMDFFVVRDGGETGDVKYNKLRQAAIADVKGSPDFVATASDIQFPDGGVLWIYWNRGKGDASH
jgi:4-amino-4-deoxy-L-arabinose transferase-like glycosyltransferase